MNQCQRFGLRKLSIGVASVLLGTTFFMGTQVAQADTLASSSTEEQPASQQVTSVAKNESATENTVQLTKQTTATSTEGGSTTSQSTTPVSDHNSATQTVNVKAVQESATNQVNAKQVQTKLVQTADAQITDNGQTEVTLTHGQQQDRRTLAFSIIAKAGDNVTVTTPEIFDASADSDPSVGVSVVENKVDSGQSFTYSFTAKSNNSYSLNIILKPLVNDWALLPAGNKYAVNVEKNGNKIAQLVYTIDQPAVITDSKVSVDPNQHGNLVQGQKYAVAVNLPNTGANDGDNFKGTVTVQVPEGFQLESNGAYGLAYPNEYGNTDRTFPSGFTSISQPGGTGTPVIIGIDNGKGYLNDNLILFWGTYTKTLSAEQNNFKVDVNYQTENNGKVEALVHTFNGTTQAINLPVTDEQRSSIAPTMNLPEKVATDNGTANGKHQSDETDKYKYPGGWSFNLKNDGNVVQTNVKLHLDVEPGTIFRGPISLTSTGENTGVTVTATLTDGSTITLLAHKTIGVNDYSYSVPINNDPSAEDGSNIKAIDMTFDQVQAGSGFNINLNDKGAILSAATTKKVDDQAEYGYKVTSDQGIVKSDTKDIKIVAPDPIEQDLVFSGHSVGFTNGNYDKNATGTAALKSGQIGYIITHSKEDLTRPSSYLLVVPAGFHVVSESDIGVMYRGKYLSAPQAKVTALGAVGPAGEYVYRLDLSFTPGYDYNGNPVYVQKADNVPIPLAINARQGAASYNYVQHENGNMPGYPVGIALLMEINTDGLVKNDGSGFQANDFKQVTLGNQTYNVMPESLGWHGVDGHFSDAKYTFLGQSRYGSDSGIKNNHEASYHDAFVTGSTNFTYSANQNGVPDATYSNGQIRLTNMLTDGGTSNYSYNVINLPATANGNPITLSLTGKGTMVGDNTGSSELLYSLTPVTKENDLTEADLTNFVTADQITDWSKVRAVLLKSNKLTNGAVINAYIPFTVSGMRDGKESVDYDLQNLFTGDHKGSTFNNNGVMPLHVDRYVQVTTNWLKKNTDGTPTPIKGSVNVNVESGKNYSTDPLSTTEIPQNYHLQETPTNATGTAGAQNIVINYIYVPNAAQQAQLNFVDDDDPSSTKMPASISAQGDAGSEISFKNQEGKSVAEIVEGLENDHYVLAKGGVVTNPSSTDWTTIFGTYDSDDQTTQSFTIHFTHATQPVTENATASETINYVYSDKTKAADPYNQKITYSHSGTKDLVTGVTKWNNATSDNLGGWQMTDSTAFVDVSSPKIDGYTPDYAKIEAPKVKLNELKKGADQGNTFTVTYSIDQQKATLNFVDENATGDETKNPEESISAEGNSDTPISFKNAKNQTVTQIINALSSKGYTVAKVVNDADPDKNLSQDWTTAFGNFDQDKNKNQSFTIYLKHQTQSVTENAQVTETINYLYKDTNKVAAPQYTKTVAYTRTGTKDLVSNQTQWNQDGWATKDGLTDVDSPTIDGYTADNTTVAAPKVDTTSLKDQGNVTLTPINVYYTKNATKQTAILNLVDDDEQGTAIGNSVTATGLSGTPIKFTDVASSIKKLENQHYLLENMTSGTENINKTALLLLLLATNNNQVKISDNTDWSTIFGKFDDDDNTNQVFTLHFKHDHGPVVNKIITETIHYVGTPTALSAHQARLTFVANDGSYRDLVDSKLDHISGWHLNGDTTDTGSFASVANPQVNGYHVVSAVTNDAQNALEGNQVKAFDGIKSDSNNIEVTVTYAKDEPVTPTTEEVSDSKTVTETIHYVYSDGTKAHDDYVASEVFTRTGTKNLTTGETTWDAWAPASAEFKAVQSPVIAGATPDQSQVAKQTVAANSDDVVITVTYTKSQQPTAPTQPTSPEQPTVPAQPTTPEKPVIPVEPVTPTEPVQPELPNEPATSSQAVQPTNSVQVTKEQVSQPAATVSPVLSKSTTKALPQTGNEQKAGLIGLGFASLLGALGLGALMKRHDSEKKF